MPFNIDQSGDFSGRELFQMFQGVALPEYVKTSQVEGSWDLEGLPKEAFADEVRKAFPINTPERVFVSNAYLRNKEAGIARVYGTGYVRQVAAKIKEAADILGITQDCEAFTSDLMSKKAADYGTRFMVELPMEEGQAPMLLYPIKTADDISESAEHFAKNLNCFPFAVRVKAAETFLKTAQALEVEELPDIICKYAGLFFPDMGTVAQEIWRRSTKLSSESNRQVYEMVARDVENVSEQADIFKIAEILYHIEDSEGLYDKQAVARVLGDPVDLLFTLSPEKVAQDLDVVEVHGSLYHMSDLQQIPREKFAEAFGFDIDPSDSEQLHEVLPTMPRSDMQMLQDLTGLTPVK